MQAKGSLLDSPLKSTEEVLIVLFGGGQSPIDNKLPVGLPKHAPVVHHFVAILSSLAILSRNYMIEIPVQEQQEV